MPPISSRQGSRIMIAGLAVLSVLWLVLLLWGWRLPASTWERIIPGFHEAEAASALGPSPSGSIPRIVAKCLGVLTLLTIGSFALIFFRDPLRKPEFRERIWSISVAAGVTWILFEGMLSRGSRAPWYNIETMMTNPGMVPVFGQRLLLVWPAMLLKYLAPGLSYIQAFLAIQAGALAIAVYVIGEWSALFIGERLKFLGQILLAVFLLPTFKYFNAHDVGVVILYTLCLFALYKRNYWLFGIVFCVGVLNHPNTLVLIPVAAAAAWGREKRSTVFWLVVLPSAGYVIIRLILNAAVPLAYSEEIKVWWNMRMLAGPSRELIMGQMSLLPWYVLCAVALGRADGFLQRAAILLPVQYAIFCVFGMLNEARIFDGFIPVMIGIFLCYLRDYITGFSGPTFSYSRRP
jgi:hypothetical protein